MAAPHDRNHCDHPSGARPAGVPELSPDSMMSMNDSRRISLVTSSYNQGRFIRRTIESVLSQDYPNFEHIVVDGMSTDDTADVLNSFPHLRVIREPDGGQADAINKGFRAATGKIFAFLNSDDTLEPGALSSVARAIDPAA